MKVKIVKKHAKNHGISRTDDVVFTIIISSKDNDSVACATEKLRDTIHNNLRGNQDYIYSRIVLSDSLSYPDADAYISRPKNSEVIEVVYGYDAEMLKADIFAIIVQAMSATMDEYPCVDITLETYTATSANDVLEHSSLVRPPLYINPERILTDSANSVYNDIIEIMMDTAFGNNLVVSKDVAITRYKQIITNGIMRAYEEDDECIVIPFGFVKISSSTGARYSTRKIEVLSSLILMLSLLYNDPRVFTKYPILPCHNEADIEAMHRYGIYTKSTD